MRFRLVLVFCIAVFIIPGCGEVKYHKAYVPETNEMWQKASILIDDYESVSFTCNEVEIEALEVVVEEGQKAVGPIIPVIPNNFNVNYSAENPNLSVLIFLREQNPQLGCDRLNPTILFEDEVEPINPIMISKGQELAWQREPSCVYTFDRGRNKSVDFSMFIQDKENECEIPPLKYIFVDEHQYRILPPTLITN